MKIIENVKLNNFDLIRQNVDDISNLPYIPTHPLEPINMFSFFVGASGSGKTSLVLQLLCSHPTKKHPEKSRAYYKFFDRIYLISASLQSLPMDKLNLNEERVFTKYSDEIMKNIIKTEQEDEEANNVLIILDDVIKSLKNNKEAEYLTKCILNRRHILNNKDKPGSGGLSIWIMSQKFNALPLIFRINASSVYLLRSVINNQKEKSCIKDELMADLSNEEQEDLFKMAFKKKYSNLLILNKQPKKKRYYSNFNLIKFDDSESDSD